jgi:hypothetical protein
MKTRARWIALMVTLSTVALARAGPPKIEVSPAVYDFGTIAETAQVETTISVHNAGESTLEILSVTTSCGCTKAQVADEKIEPGQTTTVKIIFDARSHVGERKTPQETPEAVVHAVYLRTNDPQRPEVEIEIRAQLISPSPALREGVGVRSATIYYNEACHDCTIYLDHELIPLLQELGNQADHQERLHQRAQKPHGAAGAQHAAPSPPLSSKGILRSSSTTKLSYKGTSRCRSCATC